MLTAEQIAALTPEQMLALTPEHFAAMTAEQGTVKKHFRVCSEERSPHLLAVFLSESDALCLLGPALHTHWALKTGQTVLRESARRPVVCEPGWCAAAADCAPATWRASWRPSRRRSSSDWRRSLRRQRRRS
eukprot:8572317-Pyramimonas_sp.AAC.1